MTPEIQTECVCGSTDIEHSHDNKWKCGSCGRFHDSVAMDRLAERTRMNNRK